MTQKFRAAKLSFLPLIMTIFVCVSGGPYGLEKVMGSGAGMGLLLILLTPLVWALPVALMSAELGSAFPEEGGYYIWVKRGLGPMAGFFCAWLTYLYYWVDLAIYPVMFIGYFKNFPFASFLNNPMYAFGCSLVMIVPLTWLNIRGVKTVGNTSVIITLMLIIPFIIMVLWGSGSILSHPFSPFYPMVPQGVDTHQAFFSGLYIVMWNYMGWDSLSTISGEVDKPKKNFPRALFIALIMVMAIYFLPAWIGISLQPDTTKWTEGSWPAIARIIGGTWFGELIAVCGVASACGLFISGLLASSRVPMVLAEDGLLPRFFTKHHPRYGTPWVAILVSACIYTGMSLVSFEQLAEFDVLLYSMALVLELVALLVLRIKQPELNRPFRIGGGWIMLLLVVLLPLSLIVLVFSHSLHENSHWPIYIVVIALFSGLAVWFFRAKTINSQVKK